MKITFKEYIEFYNLFSEIKYLVYDDEIIYNLQEFVASYFGYCSKEMADYRKFKLCLREIKNVYDLCHINKFDGVTTDVKVGDLTIEIDYDCRKIMDTIKFCKQYFNGMVSFVEANYYDILYKLTKMPMDVDMLIEKNNFAFKHKHSVIHICKIDDDWWFYEYKFNVNLFKMMLGSNGIITKKSNLINIIPYEIKNKMFSPEELI